MAEPCNDLPEECWDQIFTKLDRDCEFDSLSLVCKRFYALTNSLRHRLSVTDPIITGTLPRLLLRFPNLVSVNLSNFRGDVTTIFSEIWHRCLLNLQELDISNQTRIPFDESMDSGSVFKNLKVLKCKNLHVLGNSHLKRIACCFPCLEELDISFPRAELHLRSEDLEGNESVFTDDGIEALSLSLKELRKINLSGNSYITDRSIAALSNCLNLRSIEILSCCFITANGIHLLLQNSAKMNSVSVFGITCQNSNLIAQGFSTYGRALQAIDLHCTIISDECLSSLAKACLPLNRFSLVCCKGITSNGLLSLLSAYPLLQYLALEIDFLTDEIMEVLSLYLRSAVTIKLTKCSRLTISTIFALARNCDVLEELDMENTGLGRKSGYLDWFKSSTIFALTRKCDVLEELDMENTGLGRKGGSLDCYKSSKLKCLNMRKNFKVSDKCLAGIAFVCRKLEKLDVSFCSGISKEGIGFVLHICPEIRSLKIDSCLGIESIGEGPELPKLEVLSAARSGLNDSGLAAIGMRCSGLLNLVLEGCIGVTTSGVEEVAKKCKRLREIKLGMCTHVDPSVVERIVFSCPSLRRVTFTNSKLTEESNFYQL
ncbi:F-box/LRR-repeat protein 4-like [Ipomoea triloba]|uniref:F-box/LRR-repeat protein 4-like n=1 Tax=Ipomoea triloba TaxID=35885 RepID=UPI00125CE50B|nr:F-box/LRR-repeat protein 4-like [Ipomoea triloba]